MYIGPNQLISPTVRPSVLLCKRSWRIILEKNPDIYTFGGKKTKRQRGHVINCIAVPYTWTSVEKLRSFGISSQVFLFLHFMFFSSPFQDLIKLRILFSAISMASMIFCELFSPLIIASDFHILCAVLLSFNN